MNAGDLCLAYFPFTDGTSAKLRPILIVSAAQFNGGEDVVALPLTSKPDASDQFSILLDDKAYKVAGLRCPSAIKWSKPATISRLVVKRRLGSITPEMLDDVRGKLSILFGGVTESH